MNNILQVLILTFIQELRKTVPENYFQIFETKLKGLLSVQPIEDVLMGAKPNVTLGALQNALEFAANSMPENSNYKFYFYNPVISAMLRAWQGMTNDNPTTTKKLDKKKSASLKTQERDISRKNEKGSNPKIKPNPIAISTTSQQREKKTKPTKKDRDNAEKAIITDKAYDELRAHITSGRIRYPATSPVTCTDTKCTFCCGLLKNLPMTPCLGHPPCLESSWFPHCGKGLWLKLAKAHNIRKVKGHEWSPRRDYTMKRYERRSLNSNDGLTQMNSHSDVPPADSSRNDDWSTLARAEYPDSLLRSDTIATWDMLSSTSKSTQKTYKSRSSRYTPKRPHPAASPKAVKKVAMNENH